MIIGSISENIDFEKRVAITPDIIKKYKSLGLEVCLSKNYASHLGINDEEYKTEGARILNNNDEVLSSSDVILQLNILVKLYFYTSCIYQRLLNTKVVECYRTKQFFFYILGNKICHLLHFFLKVSDKCKHLQNFQKKTRLR